MLLLLSGRVPTVHGAIPFMPCIGRAVLQQQIDKSLSSRAGSVLAAIDNRQRANETATGQRPRHQQSSLDFLMQRRLGEESHAAGDLDAFLDVLDVVVLQLHLDRYALLSQEAIDLTADTQVFIEGDVSL